MIKVYHRYLFRLWLADFALGFSVLSLLLIAGNLVKIGISLVELGPLLPSLFGSMLVYALPMACITACLSTLARCRADSQFTVLAASGIPVQSVMSPFVVAGLVLALGTFVSFEWLQPWAERSKRLYLSDLGASLLAKELSKRQSVLEVGGVSLRTFEGRDGSKPVVVHHWQGDRLEWEVVARDLQVDVRGIGREVDLHLHEASNIRYDGKGGLQILSSEHASDVLQADKFSFSESYRFVAISAMWEEMAAGSSGRLAELKGYFYEKCSMVLAPLLFALVSFNLAFLGERSSRLMGFLLGLGLVFVFYYPLLMFCKEAVENGFEPAGWLMQTANLGLLLLFVTGVGRLNRRI